ncbi:MAG: hypothetical protein U1C96_10815 [Gallionella sp.]|nr:hypothetical protein [Pseudomonadota bacterium]MDZ4202620.1 hypothetical protein [Gallionella sp.]
MADYESALETIWRDLRQHLEWADGFLLVLLYTRHPTPARELLRRAESLLQTRGLEPLLLRPRDTAQAHAIVQTVIAARPEPGGERPAIWLDLWDRSSDAEWQAQRYEILARLNERRFLLEQKVGRPLVLILPEDDRARMHILAPDLWTVRAYSMGLPVPEMAVDLFQEELGSIQPLAEAVHPLPNLAEIEWRRLLAVVPEQEHAIRLNPRDGVAASQAALERGAIAEAISYAEIALSIARARLAASHDDIHLKSELAYILGAVGAARKASGNISEAREACQESLELARQAREISGDTAPVLFQLLSSLDNIGEIQLTSGCLGKARLTFLESLDIARKLQQIQGLAALASTHLLPTALENVGWANLALGDFHAARAAYSEQVQLARTERQAEGDTPSSIRALSVALNNLGRACRNLGDMETARSVLSEGLELSRLFLEARGDLPLALHDIALSLYYVGSLASDLGSYSDAHTAFQEGAELAARLVALQPDHPGYRKLQAQFQAELEKLPL